VGVGTPRHLTERFPSLRAGELVLRFHPPRRFAGVRFETYVPDPAHPSQAAALAEVARFAASLIEASAPPSRRWSWRRGSVAGTDAPPGRYLDGGFGVGKTHLLAALWHAAPPPKAYLTFEELTAVIGFLGMPDAVALFAGYRLLCIDEFELDDVANTLMAVTFLRSIIPGTKVATTSNALPDRLGEGRFSADEFRREVAAIASHFEVVRVDGDDYRARSRAAADPAPASVGLPAWPGVVSCDGFDALLAHLRVVHPVQFGALLDGLDGVTIDGLHPIANQGDALLFVQLIDELYDAEITFAATGCPVGELFPASYRNGGYRKKYGRAESRLAAMLAESAAPS
jgi:cell division protein ZapE